jgi:metal-responsive CopG/Arc/MetJ family transcriptional regulator
MQRCTFMIEPELLERLRAMAARTGLSQSEQIRQGIRWWLESREWPLRSKLSGSVVGPDDRQPRAAFAPRGPRKRR